MGTSVTQIELEEVFVVDEAVAELTTMAPARKSDENILKFETSVESCNRLSRENGLQ